MATLGFFPLLSLTLPGVQPYEQEQSPQAQKVMKRSSSLWEQLKQWGVHLSEPFACLRLHMRLSILFRAVLPTIQSFPKTLFRLTLFTPRKYTHDNV